MGARNGHSPDDRATRAGGLRPTSAPAPDGTFLRWLEDNSRRYPNKVFIHSIDQDKAITHSQMYVLCCQIAHCLAARGIGRNDRIALLANNSIEHLAVYMGVLAYGATICTINVEMNEAYFDGILHNLGSRLLLYESGLELETLVRAVPSESKPLGEWCGEWNAEGGTGFFSEVDRAPADTFVPINVRQDVASIFYTSGTESKPKGVVCTYAELYDNVEPTADAFGMTADDRILDFRSFNWVSAQVLSALGPLCRGATLLLARKFSRSRYFDWVRTHKATIGAGNPTTINMFINRPVNIARSDIPHFRFMTSSSAPLLVEDWRTFEKMYGIPIAQGFGASEVAWIAGSNEMTRRFGSVGKPLAYQNVKIVNGDGNEMRVGEIGAIEVGRGPSNEYRYLASDGSLRINAKGRIRTGDLGYIDEDGFLYVTGRTKDLIIRGGINISPIEIDNVVGELVEVAEVATVGVPDPIYGEEIIVYVARKPGASLSGEAILSHCGNKLPHAKMPKMIVFRDSLPKTERGKLHRGALAAHWKAEHPA